MCNVSDGSRYYDAIESECLLCDENAAWRVAAFVGATLAVVLVIFVLMWVRPDRKVKCLARLSLRLRELYRQVSLRAKSIGDSNRSDLGIT